MPCLYKWIKPGRIILFAVFYLALFGTLAEAEWFIDAEKFHVSAHGQTSCQDCHTDIIDRPLHPDPSHVSKQLTDFFDSGQCVECHDNVPEDLESNQHGGREINPAESYENCIDCHNPHQTFLSDDGTGNFDPEKLPAQQCGACHERQTKLPAFEAEDETCMTCHRLIGADDLDAAEKIGKRCFYCHANGGTEAQKITGQSVALAAPESYRETPHSNLACTECHLQAASFEHGAQQTVDCGQCHLPHDESTAHDAHASVACQACHLQDVAPVKDAESGYIFRQRERHLNEPLGVHEMIIPEDEAACRRCHSRGNTVGASAVVLPPKSVICMPCHTATLSFGDSITTVSLIVFFAGLGMSLLLMLSVSSGKKDSAVLTGKTIAFEAAGGTNARKLNRVRFVKEIVLNVFFQKRLFKHSPGRWLIHGLLFFPMALRFFWGIVALGGSLWRPQWQWVWQVIDKNNGVTAFFFDITGIMIFSGVILALSRHLFDRSHRIVGLPRRSSLALVLLGGIVVVGFVLEGMRIVMTGAAGSAAYAFVGFGISKLFSNPEVLSDVYGYGWYVHAVLTGAFIAFLPFSRLLHIILSPVVLALNAATTHE
jgi:nitrate reductase gamma subunit